MTDEKAGFTMRNALFGGKLDFESLVAKALEHIDMEQIARNAMAKLIIRNEDLYFVVLREEGHDDYHFIGMSYSQESARKLKSEDAGSKIIRLNIGQLIGLAIAMGAAEIME
jgi:hypothetical protein